MKIFSCDKIDGEQLIKLTKHVPKILNRTQFSLDFTYDDDHSGLRLISDNSLIKLSG